MKPRASASESLALLALFLYGLCVLVWLLWQPVPPLQDFVEWVYQGWIGVHLLRGDPSVVKAFTLVRYPVPNELAQILLTVFEMALGSFLGAKVFLVLLTGASAALCVSAGKRWNVQTPAALSLVLFLCFFLNSSLWNGYVGYQLSLVLLLCFLLVQERVKWPLLMLFGVAIFACHASTFLAYVLVVFFAVVVGKRRIGDLAALLPSLGMMAWYLLARKRSVADSQLAQQYDTGLVKHLEYKAYTLTKLGPFQNLIDAQHQGLAQRNHILYLAGVGVNAIFILLLLSGISLAFYKTRNAGLRNPNVLAAAVLFLCFLVLGSSAFGVVNLGERLLYPSLLMMMMVIGGPRFLRSLAAIGVVGASLTLGQAFAMKSPNAQSPTAYYVSPNFSVTGKYEAFGLYSHELFVDDDRRFFLEDPSSRVMPDLRFDTSLIRQRSKDR